MPLHSHSAPSVRRQIARGQLPVRLQHLTAACLILLLAAINILLPVQAQSAAPGWTVELSLRYLSEGSQSLKPEPGTGEQRVDGREQWRIEQSLSASLPYTMKVRGAVAKNQPDRHNEQRYDSWLLRPGSAGLPATGSLNLNWQQETATRITRADGEGAGAINRANAGRIGRVEHVRQQFSAERQGADFMRLHGAYLQIDRSTGKLLFEVPAIELDAQRVGAVMRRASRMDKPAASGEWDPPGTGSSDWKLRQLVLPDRPEPIEFDLPAGWETQERITLTQTVPARGASGMPNPLLGQVQISLNLIRGGAAARAELAPQSAPGTPQASAPTPTTAMGTENTAAAPAATPVQTPPAPNPAANAASKAAEAVNKLRSLLGR
ncbi:hypothetical protein [Piscinibacterium candidicorallinum]|uniref:DUF3108 domain-containing protein n=1 Tax=Piscinibacterium candidicorallinum TaxID=1793872 RepID=A0ABV7H3A0_9BURK